jgi:Mn-containing catalase
MEPQIKQTLYEIVKEEVAHLETLMLNFEYLKDPAAVGEKLEKYQEVKRYLEN